MQRTITINVVTHSDDWDRMDGIPRWAWRLDEEVARLASHGEDPRVYIALAQAHAQVFNVPEKQLANWLEDCRRARNKVVVTQDYSGSVQ